MKKLLTITLSGILLFAFLSSGCLKQDELRPAPTISFISGGSHISGDYSAYAGEAVLVGLNWEWNGTDPVKTVAIYVNRNYLSGYDIPNEYSQSYHIDSMTIVKSGEDTEEWLFQVIDSQGASSFIGFNLNLNKNGGAINQFTTTIGAPQNTSVFSYYSALNNTALNADGARNVQNTIDFLGAYDDTNANNLVSPDANNLPEPFKTELAGWTTKNSTKFCATELRTNQFDYINLDNLIVSSFSTNPDDQKNKAKNLKADDIYSFKLADGRYGLFKVLSVTPGIDGKVNIEIKVQKQ